MSRTLVIALGSIRPLAIAFGVGWYVHKPGVLQPRSLNLSEVMRDEVVLGGTEARIADIVEVAEH